MKYIETLGLAPGRQRTIDMHSQTFESCIPSRLTPHSDVCASPHTHCMHNDIDVYYSSSSIQYVANASDAYFKYDICSVKPEFQEPIRMYH